jgi:hypothetical protein
MKKSTAHLAKKPKKGKARVGWGPNDPPVFTEKTIYTYAPSPPAVVYKTNTYNP